MPIGKSLLARTAAVLSGLAVAGLANAQEAWPARPVKILVPFAAGGNTDIIARLAAERLTAAFPGSSFLVENQPGAGGVTVTAQIARAVPDGYTLLMAASPQLVIAPAMQNVPFDPVKDFTPVKIITINPFVLIAHRSSGAGSMKELLAMAKARKPSMSYASGSLGSVSHLASALLFAKAGIEATPVHYRGGAPALNDVVAGHLPMVFSSLSEALAHVKNPDVRLLAVSGRTRAPQIPDVPTVEEGGINGFELTTWNGIVGPAGLPREVVSRIETAMMSFVQDKAGQSRLRELGLEADLGTAADFAAAIKRDQPLWAEVVRIAGAREQK